MDAYFLWASVGILTFFLLIGFLCGLVRGLKRSSLHIIFFVVSIVVAFCITKTVTNAILNVTITVDGSTSTINDYILKMVTEQFNLGAYATATDFLAHLPLAIASPILFIVLSLASYIVFDILYLIIARIAFGKKKKDFKEHKPHRWFGSAVGVVEGFLFLFILFAPLTALTKTYSEITYMAQPETAQVLTIESDELPANPDDTTGGTPADGSKHLQTIPEMLNANLPKEVDEAISAYNNSILGKLCGAGGLDKALFDGLSSFKLNGEKISLRSELLGLADTYNNFVGVYNAFIDVKEIADAKYSDIDLAKLKGSIEKFLNNGIFKTVVADTARDFIANFEFDSSNPDDPTTPKEPTLFDEILLELKSKENASEERYLTAEYLKNNILQVVDVAQDFLKSKLLEGITESKDKSTIAMMETVGQNTEDVKTLIDSVFDLQLLKDIFPPLSRFLKDTLKDAGDMVNVEGLADTTTAWKGELSLLCDALEVLATNTITTKVDDGQGGQVDKTQTYIAYFMAEGEQPEDYMQTLFKEMLKEKTVQGGEGEEPTTVVPFAQLLDPVIESNIFTPLVDMVFDELDKAIAELTGVNQQTNTTSLKETKTQTISALVKLMDFALNLQDAENLDLAQVGKALDVLKENAKTHSTEGKFDGVFNETFVNLIWYLTGDSIDGRTMPPLPAEGQEAAQPNKDAETIKKYLAVEADEGSNPVTYSGYYTFESYEKAMQDVQKLLDSTKALQEIKFKDPSNPDDTTVDPSPEQIKEAVSDVVNVFAGMEEKQQNAILDAAQDMIGKDGAILDETQLEKYEDAINEELAKLKEQNQITNEVADRLKQLLGYNVNASTTPSQPEQTSEIQSLEMAA